MPATRRSSSESSNDATGGVHADPTCCSPCAETLFDLEEGRDGGAVLRGHLDFVATRGFRDLLVLHERACGPVAVANKYYLWYPLGMKISVSLPDEDVEFLDNYAESQGYESRSAVVHTAVRMLRSSKLGGAYADAWREWEESGDAELWDKATSDGLA